MINLYNFLRELSLYDDSIVSDRYNKNNVKNRKMNVEGDRVSPCSMKLI